MQLCRLRSLLAEFGRPAVLRWIMILSFRLLALTLLPARGVLRLARFLVGILCDLCGVSLSWLLLRAHHAL